MSQFGRNHPDVERLQELSNAPINESNAEAFMIFLERVFINNSWEQYEEPRRVVEQYLARLDTINDNWAEEIRNAIRNTNTQIGELRADVSPTQTEVPEQWLLNSLTGGNLASININREEAFWVWEEVIWNPLTSERIREYQERQNIWIDGKIGRETYLELRAGQLNDGIVAGIDNINTLRTRIDEIRLILESGTKSWVNIVRLIFLVEGYENQHKENNQFDRLYGEFYVWYNSWKSQYAESEEGQRVIRQAENTAWRDGRSLYAIATDESMPVSERIKAIATDPMLLMWWAILFLFWVVGGNTRFTNSFMKRLGIVIWWLMFWPAVWDRLGVWEAIDDLNQYTWATDRFNSFFDRTSWPGRERIMTVRWQSWNELNRLFPDETLLENSLAHFEVVEQLNTLSLNNLNTHISALRNNQEENIPDFLKGIVIDGVRLTNEQVAIILDSLLVTRRQSDVTIWDIFEGWNSYEVAGWALVGWWLIYWVLNAFPPIATISIIVWWSTLAWQNREEILAYLQGFEYFNWLDTRVNTLISSIGDETLQQNIRNIFQNAENSLESKIIALQTLATNHETFREQISQLSDILIGIYIEWLNAISQNISNISDLESAREELLAQIAVIQNNITDESEKQRLLTLVHDRINEIGSQTEVRRVQEARQAVTTIEESIWELRISISELEAEQTRLETEILTASAEDLITKQRRLAEIPWEITLLQDQIRSQEWELSGAEQALADIEVEIYSQTVRSHLSYLIGSFRNAVNTEGIITATNLNITRLRGIETQLSQIEIAITAATEGGEKTVLLRNIGDVRRQLEDIKTQYQSEYPSIIYTTESLEAENINISGTEGFVEFQSRYANAIRFISSEEITAFVWMSLQERWEIDTIFQAEFRRQVEIVEQEFVSAPANNIQNLRDILQQREEMLPRYRILFQTEYEDTEFQDEVLGKREVIESLNIWDIEGFNDFYRNTINTLEWTEDEKRLLLRIIDLNPSFSDLRIFYRDQIPTIRDVSENLKTLLSWEILEIFEWYIIIQ